MFDNARLKDLLPIWPWLPAFRAIAETEHLPSAATLLGVGPSSLSRSLALIERQLRKPLFRRAGRRLSLNADGQALLVATRDAMRRLDDGLQQVAGSGLRGVLRIASSGAGTTTFVAPAIGRFLVLHPELLPQVLTRSPGEVAADLLAGRIDIAFQESPAHLEGLVVDRVATLTRGVYCSRNHPLFARRTVRSADVEGQAFVAPPPASDGLPPDGWPPQRPRRIAAVVDQLRVGVEICSQLPLLAVLPDILVASRHDLRRLPVELVAASPRFAIRRRALTARPAVAAQFLAAVEGESP